MATYPVFLEMKGRRCVVIGSGAVAQRRVEGLLASGAEVSVIGPAITAKLRDLSAERKIAHFKREYQKGDLVGFDLVFAATDKPEINAAIFREASSRHIWVNSADDPDHCNFILPAVVRRGGLAVAVSSGGKSPAATRAIRQELEEYFTPDYARFVQIAGEARHELRERSCFATGKAWSAALKGDFRRLISEGKTEEAKRVLIETLEASLCQ